MAGTGPDPTAFTRELAALGIDLDMLDPTGFPFNPLAGKHPLLRSLDPCRTMAVLLFKRKYDLIVSGNEGGAVLLALLRRCFLFRTPVVIWDLSPSTEWRLRATLQDVTLPRVDGVFSLIEVQKSYVSQRWGAHVPVAVVGYGIDTEFYRPGAPSTREDYILSVGDDVGRDYQTLLQASIDLPVPLHIKTSLSLDLDPESHRDIVPLPNRLPHVEFRQLYQNCLFVVVPLQPHTRNASGASTVLEAGAMGKAVIVSDSDGVRDFVVPNETCIMVPAGDSAALRTAMDRLCREPETRRRLGEAARQFVQQRYSMPAGASMFAAAVRQFARA